MKAPIQVHFLNQEGPFVLAGFHTDPATSAA
jgi:hypothetical protein